MEPLRPQLDLPLRLLPGDIEHRGKTAQVVADLEHQGGLADAGGTPHQHQRALHRSPAQHPVQLIHPGFKAELVGGFHLAHGPGPVAGSPQAAPSDRGGGRTPFFRLCRPLHKGIPCPAGGTLAGPLWGFISALGTIKQCFCFHSEATPPFCSEKPSPLPSSSSHCSQEAAKAEASLV